MNVAIDSLCSALCGQVERDLNATGNKGHIYELGRFESGRRVDIVQFIVAIKYDHVVAAGRHFKQYEQVAQKVIALICLDYFGRFSNFRKSNQIYT